MMKFFQSGKKKINQKNIFCRVPHLVLVDPWGFSERPLDVDEHSAIPIWAKVLGTFASYFHPMAIVRLAGPMG